MVSSVQTGKIRTKLPGQLDRLPWPSLKYRSQLTYDRHLPPGQENLSLGVRR